MRVFHSGPEQVVTYADNQMAGIEIDQAPVQVDMSRYRDRPRSVLFRIPAVPSGLYYVQFGSADGRVGYAPFVVRPAQLGATGRVLVVLPTNTWQAYNFQDVDGNGYGDTWYAGPPNLTVDLSRTYIARGVPPRFYRYDLPFLHWLYWSGKSAEFISDSDFDQIASGDELAQRLRPDRLRGPRGVRDEPRVRRHPALPRPRRQPDVPLGRQLLLEGAQDRAGAAQDRLVPHHGTSGGGARRHRVPRERRRPAPGALRRRELGGGAVALGRHGPRRRLDVRAVRRRLRHRDRLDDAAVAARARSCSPRSPTCSGRASPPR